MIRRSFLAALAAISLLTLLSFSTAPVIETRWLDCANITITQHQPNNQQLHAWGGGLFVDAVEILIDNENSLAVVFLHAKFGDLPAGTMLTGTTQWLFGTTHRAVFVEWGSGIAGRRLTFSWDDAQDFPIGGWSYNENTLVGNYPWRLRGFDNCIVK